eukprot:5713499-Amphidinium_carterae.3
MDGSVGLESFLEKRFLLAGPYPNGTMDWFVNYSGSITVENFAPVPSVLQVNPPHHDAVLAFGRGLQRRTSQDTSSAPFCQHFIGGSKSSRCCICKEQLPVKIALAREFAVFNKFYAAVPGRQALWAVTL